MTVTSPAALLTFRHLWGVFQPLAQAAARFQQAGYAGLEANFGNAAERRTAVQILGDFGLKNVALVATQPSPDRMTDVSAHLRSLERGLQEALETGPLCINVQAGYDAWMERDVLQFFEATAVLVADVGVPVGFETHRGRCLSTPWQTAAVLGAVPDIRLTLDLSHWVLICERLPDDLSSALQQAVGACIHIHARVGSEQAPQVNDPRAPEHARLLAWFERQWQAIWASQRAQGHLFSTMTPEFGPPDYQPTQPYSRLPTADLDEICDWMLERQHCLFHS